MDGEAHWLPLESVEPRVPQALRSWLAEPGLLTARIRALCGERLRFGQLGHLHQAPLPQALRRRLTVEDDGCLLREVEFRCDDRRVVYAQTVLPATTVEGHPWLHELGDAPLGETLRRHPEPLEREPLEYRALPAAHPLALAAWADETPAVDDGELWARRAVYRLGGHPILVQEVFLPALLQVRAGR